jgi:glycosyltransferase involved in cell wall biosynthesis
MCKNESKRIHVTLNSIIGIVDSLVIYDTGSTDNTIEIIKQFSETNNIPLHLLQGTFIDFSTSRNTLLNYADTIDGIDYLLLLDANDELKGGKYLRELCEKYLHTDHTGFLLCQEWWSGHLDKYYNMRLIKPRSNWKYCHPVHEWLHNTTPSLSVRFPDEIVVYQDRTQDDDKSFHRFKLDKEILLKEHKLNPSEPRITFYLAQTFLCLSEIEDAFYYYKLRTHLQGFEEERFISYLKCGELSEKLNHPWSESMAWYIKAFEHSERVEPLLKLVEHYRLVSPPSPQSWKLAFSYISIACELSYPTDCILFVDKLAYTYKRWHLLGIVGFYCNKLVEGKLGCLKALEHCPESDIDKRNLTFYSST